MRLLRPSALAVVCTALAGAGLFAPHYAGSVSFTPDHVQPARSQGPARAADVTASATAPTTLRISTFNLLGSQHTAAVGGDEPWYAPGQVRADWDGDIIRSMGSDIVGFDEMQNDQLAALRAQFPDFTLWPGTALGEPGRATTMMWRTSKFTMLSSTSITIPFQSQQRKMSIVKLEDKPTGRQFYVLNAHNAPQNLQTERNKDISLEIAEINKLRKTGLPVFFIGDLNEHAPAFCPVIQKTDLTSPAGGSATASTCTTPRGMRIDWIFGNASWSNYVVSRTPLIQRATDHAVLAATASFN